MIFEKKMAFSRIQGIDVQSYNILVKELYPYSRCRYPEMGIKPSITTN